MHQRAKRCHRLRSSFFSKAGTSICLFISLRRCNSTDNKGRDHDNDEHVVERSNIACKGLVWPISEKQSKSVLIQDLTNIIKEPYFANLIPCHPLGRIWISPIILSSSPFPISSTMVSTKFEKNKKRDAVVSEVLYKCHHYHYQFLDLSL